VSTAARRDVVGLADRSAHDVPPGTRFAATEHRRFVRVRSSMFRLFTALCPRCGNTFKVGAEEWTELAADGAFTCCGATPPAGCPPATASRATRRRRGRCGPRPSRPAAAGCVMTVDLLTRAAAVRDERWAWQGAVTKTSLMAGVFLLLGSVVAWNVEHDDPEKTRSVASLTFLTGGLLVGTGFALLRRGSER
jgi:hypothetical protein